MALHLPTWTKPWATLDTELRAALVSVGLENPILFAGTFDSGSELRDELLQLLEALNLPDNLPENLTRRLDNLEALHAGATAAAERYHTSQAATDDGVLADDLAVLRRREATAARATTVAVAQAEHLTSLPGLWTGKAYRRKEAKLNPAE